MRNDTFTPGVKGVPNVPYGADRLAEDFSDKMAFIFEGEKDVERAWDRGLLATCNVGGAKNWKGRTERASQGSQRLYRARQ